MARDNCVTECGNRTRLGGATSIPTSSRILLEIETAIIVAFRVADVQARKSGKIYLVASSPRPSPAVYVFACDQPDARNPAINIMFEQTPAGERIRFSGIRSATRH